MSKDNGNNNDGGDEDEDAYEVGYKKPPKNHQFKPNESGNKKGRPKNSKNMRTLFAKECLGEKDALVNGLKTKLSPFGASLKMLCDKASKGDIRATETLFKFADKLGFTKDEVITTEKVLMAPPAVILPPTRHLDECPTTEDTIEQIRARNLKYALRIAGINEDGDEITTTHE